MASSMPKVPAQIKSYGDLKKAVALWIDRDDPEFVDQIPTFINFAEKEIYRNLRIPRFEREIYLRIREGMAYIPADCVEINYIMHAHTGKVFRTTSPEELDWLRRGMTKNQSSFNQQEIVWTRTTGRFYFYPPITANIPTKTTDCCEETYDGSEVLISYYRDTSEMVEDTDTCAIITIAPELFLYMALKHACLFVQDDNGVQKWGAMANASMAEIDAQAKRMEYSGSPLVIPNAYGDISSRTTINYGVDYNTKP